MAICTGQSGLFTVSTEARGNLCSRVAAFAPQARIYAAGDAHIDLLGIVWQVTGFAEMLTVTIPATAMERSHGLSRGFTHNAFPSVLAPTSEAIPARKRLRGEGGSTGSTQNLDSTTLWCLTVYPHRLSPSLCLAKPTVLWVGSRFATGSAEASGKFFGGVTTFAPQDRICAASDAHSDLSSIVWQITRVAEPLPVTPLATAMERSLGPRHGFTHNALHTFLAPTSQTKPARKRLGGEGGSACNT